MKKKSIAERVVYDILLGHAILFTMGLLFCLYAAVELLVSKI